jgi:hypothetical protein
LASRSTRNVQLWRQANNWLGWSSAAGAPSSLRRALITTTRPEGPHLLGRIVCPDMAEDDAPQVAFVTVSLLTLQHAEQLALLRLLQVTGSETRHSRQPIALQRSARERRVQLRCCTATI